MYYHDDMSTTDGDAPFEELRAAVAARRDAEGNSFDSVRVVFYEEAQARRAAQRVRHAGAKVYYMDPT